MNQQTLKKEYHFNGKSLHTGADVSVCIKPAEIGTGILFVRTDLGKKIPAIASKVVNTARSTQIGEGDAVVGTVEHILSAFTGLGIDNAIVEVSGSEMPILDGSASVYVKAFLSDGLLVQDASRKYIDIQESIVIENESGSRIEVTPADKPSIDVEVDFSSEVLGVQTAHWDESVDYASQIAPCRTFCFLHELEQLLSLGLVKGGDVDNALVFVNKELSEEELEHLAKLFNKDISKLEVHEGTLNNVQKYFDNEPARHKLLDLLGDLSLLGTRLVGRVIAQMPGHTANTAFAKKLRKDIKRMETSTPIYRPEDAPLMDVNRIKQLLPHRYPFLLVDKVVSRTETSIVTVKNITFNEMQFLGHFPEEPVMPGVLQVEAMAQSAGLLVLSQVEDPERYSTYFLKINNVKFRNKVVPGDTMVMKVMLTSPIRRGLSDIKGYVFVGGKIVTEAEMVAQIVKNK